MFGGAQLHTVNRTSEAGPCSDPGTLRRRIINRKDKEDMDENNTPDLSFLDDIPITEITLNKWRENFERIDNLIPFIEKIIDDNNLIELKNKPREILVGEVLSSVSISGEKLDVPDKEFLHNIYFEASELQKQTRHKIIKFSRNTGLSVVSDTEQWKNIRGAAPFLPGQLRFEWNEAGDVKIIDGTRNDTLKKAIAEKGLTGNYNTVLLETIGTAIEPLYSESESPIIGIPREGLAEFLDVRINKPPQNVLDFILKDESPKTPEEIEQKTHIEKNYSFWVDLLNLRKAGVFKTKSGLFAAFVFHGYDEERDLIYCESPFLYQIYQDIYANKIQSDKKRNDRPIYEIPEVTRVIRGNINKNKNEAAKEIIEYIVIRIARHGTSPNAERKQYYNYKDKEVIEFVITYDDLINNCSVLAARLAPVELEDGTIKEVKAPNKINILNRAIFGKFLDPKYKDTPKKRTANSLIESLVNDCTDLKQYYINFSIKADPVSLKTLKSHGLHIKHYGINGEYKDNPTLTKPEVI